MSRQQDGQGCSSACLATWNVRVLTLKLGACVMVDAHEQAAQAFAAQAAACAHMCALQQQRCWWLLVQLSQHACAHPDCSQDM